MITTPAQTPGCSEQRYKGLYSRRYVAFVKAHYEAFHYAYLDQSGSSRNELARLQREYRTLPPRHICTCATIQHWPLCTSSGKCQCPQLLGHHCLECRRVSAALNEEQLPPEMGRSGVHGSRVPLLIVLDIEAGYAA